MLAFNLNSDNHFSVIKEHRCVIMTSLEVVNETEGLKDFLLSETAYK